MKIIVLKSAGESREDVKEYAEKIIEHLGIKFISGVIDFSIFISKWGKAQI